MKISKSDIKLLIKLFKMSVNELHNFCKEVLNSCYEKGMIVEKKGSYLVAVGSKIGLVAHLDTSGDRYPNNIVYNKKYITAIDSILGADDRVGVFIILKMLEYGYRPTILFTHGEEKGGLGARDFVEDYSDIGVNYLVQLDRRGDGVVFYNNDNREFIDYILSFRDKEEFGSFSDISVLCPNCNVSGCNLGVGYFNEHTSSEYQDLNILANTIEVVKKLLDDENNSKYFEYEEGDYGIYDVYEGSGTSDYIIYEGEYLTLEEYYDKIYGQGF